MFLFFLLEPSGVWETSLTFESKRCKSSARICQGTFIFGFEHSSETVRALIKLMCFSGFFYDFINHWGGVILFVTEATGNKKMSIKYGQIEATNQNQEFREIMQRKHDDVTWHPQSAHCLQLHDLCDILSIIRVMQSKRVWVNGHLSSGPLGRWGPTWSWHSTRTSAALGRCVPGVRGDMVTQTWTHATYTSGP